MDIPLEATEFCWPDQMSAAAAYVDREYGAYATRSGSLTLGTRGVRGNPHSEYSVYRRCRNCDWSLL